MTADISQTIMLLDRLVGFDTTSHKTNIPLISWVKSYLEDYRISSRILPNQSGEKQNLIAQIGPSKGRGIVLSGHTDVVPAIGNNWTTDPFKLSRRSDKLFGRGTTDMKGFLATILAAIPQIVKAPLKRPITLAFSYDEEIGCFGAPALVAELPPAQDVIVGEPTCLHIGTQNKGARVQTLKITGIAAHSGEPRLGVNAIAHMQPALTKLIALGDTLSCSEKGYTSNLVVTSIKGGGAPNIVPDQCELTWLFRPTGIEDGNTVDVEIRKILTKIEATIKTENPLARVILQTECDVPAFHAEPASIKGDLFQTLLQGRKTTTLPFATEAGIFARAGHNVIVCGPGDMAQGHTTNEYIEIADLVSGQKFLGDILDTACK